MRMQGEDGGQNARAMVDEASVDCVGPRRSGSFNQADSAYTQRPTGEKYQNVPCLALVRGTGLLQQIAIFLYRAMGAGVAIALMEVLARAAEEPLSRVPFVTSIVLVMSLPEAEPARSYNVVGGHMLSCLGGLIAVWCFGAGDTACAVALAIAVFLMLVTGSLHPPAGINAFLIAAYNLPVAWVISPVLVGAVFLVGYKRIWVLGEQRLREFELFKKLPTKPELGPPKLDARTLARWRPWYHHRTDR